MKITHHKNGEIKTLVDEAPYNPGYEDAGFKPKAVNNKPVLWIDEINTVVLDKDYQQFPKELQNGMTPLYNHPVKELTDEEIEELIWNTTDMKDFAKAILRKAQET